MATSALVFTPLGDPSSNIRLLEIDIRDSPKRPRVTCRMRTVSLKSALPFSALSYVWGDTDERADIVVNSQLVSVTKSLEGALHCAPHLHRVQPGCSPIFFLWVDAVCIDQENPRERTAQVGLMATLYQQAECVFAWLGMEDEDPAFRALRPVIHEINRLGQDPSFKQGTIFSTLADFTWLSGHPDLCKNDVLISRDPKIQNIPTLFNARWSAINTLLSRKYWTRVWIFQEAVLAKRLILACPTSAMVFTDLGTVAIFLENLQWYLRHLPVAKPNLLGSAVWYFLRDIINWSPIVRIMRERNARKSESKPWEWVRRCALSEVGFELDATDPRDRVYGLLALTDLELKPDYEKNLSQVSIDFSTAWIKACQSSRLKPALIFLSYAGIGIFDEDPSLPSWAPNFRDQSPLKVRMMLYDANRGVFGNLTSAISIDPDNHHLITPGMEVDLVAKVHDFPQTPENDMHVSGLMKEIEGIWSIFSGKTSPPTKDSKPSTTSDKELATKKKEDVWKQVFASLYVFSIDFISRHKDGYLNGIPPLQAIFRVLWCHTMKQKVFGSTIMRGINFLKMLSVYGTRPTREENIESLGFALDDTFDATFCQKMFPIDGLEGQISAYKGSLLQEFTNWEPIGGLTEMTELNTQLSELSRSWRLVETDKGYLGLGPKGAKPGDVVTILKGAEVPVILRRNGTYFKHVGTSFILGLMDGELAGCVEDGKYSAKEITIL
ncbi:Fc.00g114760.m01.CDS01 [Cosmosporella sp. VM-42]